MLRRASFLLLIAGITLLPVAALHAAPESAVVRKVIGKASAARNATLPAGTIFSTGAASKSELAIGRGTVRVGQKAAVETTPRGLALRQGVTLVASAPGRLRDTIEVRAPGYRLKVKGTVQVAFDPGRSLKVAVLEGSATVALDSLAGEFETLKPGQMLIINPGDRRLPEPVEIDLQRLVATSALLGDGFGPLATEGSIGAGATRQEVAMGRGDLVETSLILRGVDNALEVLRPDETRPRVRTPEERSNFGDTSQELENDLADPGAVTRQQRYVFPSGTRTRLGDFTFQRDGTRNISRTESLVVALAPRVRKGQAPSVNGIVRVDPAFLAGKEKKLEFVTDAAGVGDPELRKLRVGTRANVRTPRDVGLSFLLKDGIEAKGANLTAGNGTSEAELLSIKTATGGISIAGKSKLVGGRVALQASINRGQTIFLDDSTIKAERDVSIGSATSRAAIVIQNSSQIASVLSQIDFSTNRQPITIDGSGITAPGRIALDTFGDPGAGSASDEGPIKIRNAHLNADIIKVRAYRPDDNALIIDGTTMTAAQMIKLYAEGNSTLFFRKNVKLDTALAILAGKTVEVESGGSVDIRGEGKVFTDNAKFNDGAHGEIKTSKGPPSIGIYDDRGDF